MLCVRAMVRRHDVLERKLEKAESTLSAKAETKATVQREVSTFMDFTVSFLQNIIVVSAGIEHRGCRQGWNRPACPPGPRRPVPGPAEDGSLFVPSPIA